MSSPRWEPIRLPLGHAPLSQLDEHIDRTFDALLGAPWLEKAAGWLPQLDVYETPDAFLVEADLPGVAVNDLQVRVDAESVTICGSRSDTRRDETPHGAVRIERRHGAFCRKLTLSQPVDRDRIQISHEQGVFRIRLPKQCRQDD
ncbi:Hsp20 family protein [bacterium]|nr:Hsp20 family protein [bacterium]